MAFCSTDAVQAYGQLPINVDEYHIDMLSSSGHKLNGQGRASDSSTSARV